MKIENFDKIYNSLIDFSEKRAGIIDKCNDLVSELSAALPESVQELSKSKWEKLCRNTYHGINCLLTEYSKCLELSLLFSNYLYKDKPIVPIVLSECWSFLIMYENFVNMYNKEGYSIKYEQIITLIHFIRLNGKKRDKKEVNEYLKRNRVCVYPSKGTALHFL